LTDQPESRDPNTYDPNGAPAAAPDPASASPTMPELAPPSPEVAAATPDPSQPGWAAIPSPDPAAAGAAPQVAWNPPAEKPASKLRTLIPIIVIVGIIAVVLFVTRDNQSVDDLSVGTCFDVPTANSEVSTVTKHACTEAHDAEVFHNVEYTEGGSYPISLTLDNFVDGVCTPQFGSYVGVSSADSTDCDYGYFDPTSDGWDGGDRTITCYVVRVDKAKLTQSVKGAAS
jgi:hypothetical protein